MRIIRIGTADPTVRTRKHEVVPCSVDVSNRPNHFKKDFPKKQNASALKPSCFHLARTGREGSAKLGRSNGTFSRPCRGERFGSAVDEE